MKMPILPSDVIDGLEELSTREIQERLWLSDGSSGEVSSFGEAICEVFDARMDKELRSGNIPEPIKSLFQKLRSLVGRIQHLDLTVKEFIEHPKMKEIREAAKELLRMLEQ